MFCCLEQTTYIYVLVIDPSMDASLLNGFNFGDFTPMLIAFLDNIYIKKF
jgi:hypothetical protein